MPFALEAGIGGIALAAILFLLVAGGSYLVEGIAGRLPVVSFLFIRLDFAFVFRRIALPFVAFLTALATFHFAPLENWLRGLAYSVIQTVFGNVQVQATHAGQIEHLHNVTIPDGVKSAIATAHGYTAAQVQGVRDQVHAAEIKWTAAHTYADAQAYIRAEKNAPSVENAILAMVGAAYIAGHNDLWQGPSSMAAYVDGVPQPIRDHINTKIGEAVAPIQGAIAIPRYVPGQVAIPVEAIKDGTITAVGTAVAVIAAKIVDCLVSNCQGNNNFQKLLQDALGIASVAEFAIFLKDFVENPGGTITSYTDSFGHIVTGAEKSAGDVWTEIASVLGV